MNIGLFVISTNKYHVFIDPLVNSVKQYFLSRHNLKVCLFTDLVEFTSEHLWQEKPQRGIVYLPIKHKPWPAPTLERYHTFYSFKEQLDKYNFNYVYYVDVDAKFVNIIGDEIIPDSPSKIVVATHPGFFKGGGSWEENPKSKAYIPQNLSKNLTYFAGGFLGSSYNSFMEMAQTIRDWIDEDTFNNVMAQWHDEGHFNRFVMDKEKLILSPSYLYPESWSLPFIKKLLVLDKNT